MVQNKQNVNMSSFHWIQKWSRRDSDAYFGAPSVKQTLVGRLTWPNFVSTFGIAQTSKKGWRQHILLSIASFLPQQNLQGLSYPLPSIYFIYIYIYMFITKISYSVQHHRHTLLKTHRSHGFPDLTWVPQVLMQRSQAKHGIHIASQGSPGVEST